MVVPHTKHPTVTDRIIVVVEAMIISKKKYKQLVEENKRVKLECLAALDSKIAVIKPGHVAVIQMPYLDQQHLEKMSTIVKTLLQDKYGDKMCGLILMTKESKFEIINQKRDDTR